MLVAVTAFLRNFLYFHGSTHQQFLRRLYPLPAQKVDKGFPRFFLYKSAQVIRADADLIADGNEGNIAVPIFRFNDLQRLLAKNPAALFPLATDHFPRTQTELRQFALHLPKRAVLKHNALQQRILLYSFYLFPDRKSVV